ncbi:MAG: Holliday junction resolvase RuvX [Eubacteriales bacterium]
MRAMGLDVGDKTIGVAISDSLLIIAQGYKTIERVGIRKDAGKVIDIAKEFECNKIVVGLPKMLNGTDSPQTLKVYEFKTMLENKLRSSGVKDIEIVFEDERFTTVIAERVLISADVSRKDRKKVIDKQAATIILQGYLDKMSNQAKNNGI